MVGITAYGAYIPVYRLGRETQGWGVPVEKAVANFDEDSVTMAVAATRDCLKGLDRSAVDALYFATTTAPYIEKLGATTVATACDLRRSISTADFTDTLRAATTAMRAAADAVKAGSASSVLVAAGDMRMGPPKGEIDRAVGDGAAALLMGKDNVIAALVDSYSVSNEMLDVWRAEGDVFPRSWEDRFIIDTGYMSVLPEAVSELLKRNKLAPQDLAAAVYFSPDARRHNEMARRLGLDAKAQVVDPLYNKVGNAGAAFVPMLLVQALESAKPGDKLLVAGYGDGADALLFEVTPAIAQARADGRLGVSGHLAAKRTLEDYNLFIRWRQLLASEAARRPAAMPPSAAARWRERDQIIRFHGAKCQNCGTVQYPPQRVCTVCHAKDNFVTWPMADDKGKLFTYAMDYVGGSVDVPLVISVVDFDGGGRAVLVMTDRETSEIKIGMPLEMSFRKLGSVGGVHNYYWKPTPVRADVGK